MKFTQILFYSILAGLAASLYGSSTFTPAQARQAAASEMLQPGSNDIAIFTKGAICGSCGVGIRILLSKIDGVDKERYSKGVLLDVHNQLTLVAFKPDVSPDMEAVFQAVYDAGYDPAHYYRRKGDAVVLIDFNFTPED